MKKPTVLFAGPDPVSVGQFHTQVPKDQSTWELATAESGEETFRHLKQGRFDAVIFDDEFPRSELDAFYQTLEPQSSTVAFIRSDRMAPSAEGEVPLPVLSKRSDLKAVDSAIRRGLLRRELGLNAAVQTLSSETKTVPSLPSTFQQICRELENPEVDLETVAMHLSNDPVISARVLQAVNSAAFGLAREISNTFEAVSLLGVEETRSLVLFSGMVAQFDASRCAGFMVEAYWMHSLITAQFARWICRQEACPKTTGEQAYTAGLIHDLGKLILAANLPERYTETIRHMKSNRCSAAVAEAEILGVDHALLAGYMLADWALPYEIIEAVAFHHEPQRSDSDPFSPCAAVHIADALAHERNAGEKDTTLERLNLPFLQSRGVLDHYPDWRKICGKLEDSESMVSDDSPDPA